MLLDIMVVIVSYILASYFWLIAVVHNVNNMALWQRGNIMLVALVYALGLWLFLALLGFYNSTRLKRLREKVRLIVTSNTGAIVIATGVLYLLRLQDFSRGVLGCFYVISTFALCLKYILMRRISNAMRARGRNLKHVLIIGSGHLARQYADDIHADANLGYNIIGYAGEQGTGFDAAPLCSIGGLDEYLHTCTLDEAVIALDADEVSRIWGVISDCEKNGVRYSVIPFYNDVLSANPQIDVIGRSKLMRLRTNAQDNVGLAFVKRLFDILASGLGMVVLSPLLLVLAIGVKLSSPGPILFRQERVGYNRRSFMMLKFRSMRVNAEENTAWTKDSDPRKTKFGSFIRKFSLDELPQLWNVFVGDMSLVGPRPELPYFVEQFRETIPLYMVKHQVRPGITGWAQVNGYRGDTSIEKRIEYDIWYIDNWSPLLDLKILFMTAFGGMMNTEKLATDKEKVNV